jgi:predicted O-methyltransferase YrrM
MFDSKKYWNDRYIKGQTSDTESYNKLAQFKADIINEFVGKNQIKSIIDYGIDDGNLLKLFNTEKLIYTGIDVSEFIISECKEKFKDDKTKNFIHVNNIDNQLKADLVLSCDVICHLIEDNVYEEYMDNLFSMSKKYVIIYAPNMNKEEDIHVKKREFIEYIFDNYTTFNLVERIKGNIGCPFYIFQKNDTYTPIISKNILQVTKENPIDNIIVYKIKNILDCYDYYWFNDENMYKYIKNNQLEEFPDIINHIKSLTIGQHKADIFRYYWLYLNGGIFIDDDLIIEKKLDFKNNTFVSVKSYHTNKNLLFNGFIACSKFNPIIYKALKQSYSTKNIEIKKNYHLFCNQIYNIYQQININQKTFLLQEREDVKFKDGVKIYKSYYNGDHILTHSKGVLDILKTNILNNWKNYIKNNLIPIIKNLNIKLEGNIYSSHLTFYENPQMKDKQSNICHVLKENQPKKILEIGFNAGFSCLLMKMLLPDANITCVDLNEHKYVMPCFNKISSDFKGLELIPGSSYDVGLPQLIKENKKFDFIHIDGDHRLEGATKDMELCLKLCHDKTIILFDDTNIQYIDNLCSQYVKTRKLKDYRFDKYLNNQKYKHRFLQINEYFDKSILNGSKTPIYISLTSIFKNQDILLQTLQSIMKQSRKPDKIFLYLSEEPYILDTGFKDKKITNSTLLKFINDNPNIDIKWVKNTGPYRKLLPLLRDKWDEDCIIITIDDDTLYDIHLIENLVNDYYKYKCVIGYRGFTPSIDKLENFNYEKRNKLENLSLYNFLTGKGGILYKPEFFHQTKDLIFNDKIYLDTCHTGDDIWFYLIRLLNCIKCYICTKNWMTKDVGKTGLYLSFNNKNNNVLFKNTYKKLIELGYKF